MTAESSGLGQGEARGHAPEHSCTENFKANDGPTKLISSGDSIWIATPASRAPTRASKLAPLREGIMRAGAATVVLVLAAVLVLAPLAVSFSARAVQQAANTRRRACSTWRESASESARDARGKTAGTRALLLLAVVALLLQGDDGSVKCWGWNGRGQLGYGDTSNRGDGSDDFVRRW
ncbi:hypothetical protein T484DRAFT_1827972 [Baffinella frigidus]|nr:hypothetical protein T484DRAFT_1827972 [Cryptophyta sp. CCMP2293]